MMNKLETCSLSKSYGDKIVLNDINLTFHNGIYALLGANGSGKSTLLKIICNIIDADQGEICFNGEHIKNLSNYLDNLGFMPQQQEIFDTYRAEEFLWYIASLKGLKKATTKERIDQLLDQVNLSEYKHIRLKAFSGGMKQRIMFAAALLNDPSIILLDEPTAGLDPKERNEMKRYLGSVAHDKIILFATHLISDIEYIANEVIVIKSGNVIAKGTCDELVESAKTFEARMSKEEFSNIKASYVCSFSVNENIYTVRYINKSALNSEDIEVSTRLEDVFLKMIHDDSV